MIKKYQIYPNSDFNKSIILTLFERGEYGFHIAGLNSEETNDLFPRNFKPKLIKNEVDITSFPTRCDVVYLNEDFVIKAILLVSKNKKYYLFKSDPQNIKQLNIHQKYISNNKESLLKDYEKHCKSKGKNLYEGEGDTSIVNNLNYFDYLFKDIDKSHLCKQSNIYRLSFSNNNMFTTDFVDYVAKKKIIITNHDAIDKGALTLASMGNNKTHRQDCLLIDAATKDIKYLVFTYKPHLINHYLLFKNLGDNHFCFIEETISFNEIFSLKELQTIKYKNGSAFAAISFAKKRYENFSNEYILFEEEEQFDEQIQTALPVQEEAKINIRALLNETLSIFKENNMNHDISITYHGKERILERIGEMSEEEMLSLSKVAYEKGLTSGHFIENNPMMFKFLQYQQNKKIGKTLRLYNGILFFYALEPPHSLVTCFPYESSFDKYQSIYEEKQAKNSKKRK